MGHGNVYVLIETNEFRSKFLFYLPFTCMLLLHKFCSYLFKLASFWQHTSLYFKEMVDDFIHHHVMWLETVFELLWLHLLKETTSHIPTLEETGLKISLSSVPEIHGIFFVTVISPVAPPRHKDVWSLV